MMSISHSSPLVSVILPTYNRVDLLPRAIASVLKQEYTELELIVVDDGSIDATPEVISEIQDQRLRYIGLKQNQGETFARNIGIHQAKGRFIAQMDSDDIWFPEKISYQLHILSKNMQIDFIFSNFININHITGTSYNFFEQRAQILRHLTIQEIDNHAWEIKAGFPETLLISNIIQHSSILLRRSVIQSVGMYNEKLRGSGDLEYWWRAALRGAIFAYTDRVLVERHKDAQSLTSDVLGTNMRRLQALQVCDQTARETGRLDLIASLKNAKYRSWRGIMLEHVRRNERKQVMISLLQSLKYGSSFELLSYVGNVVLGLQGVELIKKLIGMRGMELVRRLRQASKKSVT